MTPLDTIDITAGAAQWLTALDNALASGDSSAVTALFVDDGHWRDILVLGERLTTASGRDRITALLDETAGTPRPVNFRLAEGRTPPRLVTRNGRQVVELLFTCDAAWGPAAGMVRLLATEEGLRGWSCMAALQDLSAEYDDLGEARLPEYERLFGGPTWKDQRARARAYLDHDPAVLVVGGGQAGLAAAARLTNMGIDTLVIDRQKRTGDNWRNRYDALVLHNQTNMNHLPDMPFPDSWPNYIPKDKLANWFEIYAEAMEINTWNETEIVAASHDEASGFWDITVKSAQHGERHLRPRHVIFATGVSSIPTAPKMPGLETFEGQVVHSAEFHDGRDWSGKPVVVVGTGNSAHDVAQDLAANGALVTMIQRSPTYVISLAEAQKLYTLYNEGLPLEDTDLISSGTPFPVLLEACQALTERARKVDTPLLEGLVAKGFRIEFGPDDSGFQPMYLRRGGGYYFNLGCSDLIVDGTIKVVNAADVQGLAGSGLQMSDGTLIPAELVVFATGFKNQQETVRAILGDSFADRVGEVWGLDDTGELKNMWCRTAQPGLWFTGGGLGQCRIYSKYLALQIRRELAMYSARQQAQAAE